MKEGLLESGRRLARRPRRGVGGGEMGVGDINRRCLECGDFDVVLRAGQGV